jgi:hypothetical protein
MRSLHARTPPAACGQRERVRPRRSPLLREPIPQATPARASDVSDWYRPLRPGCALAAPVERWPPVAPGLLRLRSGPRSIACGGDEAPLRSAPDVPCPPAPLSIRMAAASCHGGSPCLLDLRCRPGPLATVGGSTAPVRAGSPGARVIEPVSQPDGSLPRLRAIVLRFQAAVHPGRKRRRATSRTNQNLVSVPGGGLPDKLGYVLPRRSPKTGVTAPSIRTSALDSGNPPRRITTLKYCSNGFGYTID